MKIAAERGEWPGASRYWLRRSDVVPLSEALAYFTKQIERSPTAYAYVARSRVWRIEKHDLEKALADAEAAVRLAPTFARAWMSRGECRRSRSFTPRRFPISPWRWNSIRNFPRRLSAADTLESRAGDHEGAMADAAAGLKRWPHASGWRRLRSITYWKRGIVRRIQDRPELAKQDFTLRRSEICVQNGGNWTRRRAPSWPATNTRSPVVDSLLRGSHHVLRGKRTQLREFDAAILDCTQAINHRPDYAPAIICAARCSSH